MPHPYHPHPWIYAPWNRTSALSMPNKRHRENHFAAESDTKSRTQSRNPTKLAQLLNPYERDVPLALAE